MAPEPSRSKDKILVTGITGALGGGIARLFVREGRAVVGLLRPGSDADALREVGIETVEGDITDLQSVEHAMRECGYVVHAAAITPGSGASEEMFHAVNAGGTRNVLAAAVSSGIERMVHVSTVNVMALCPGTTVDEDSPPPELTHRGYDESKMTAEHAVLEASKSELDVVVVNPAVIFGPGSRSSGRIISAFVRGRLPFVPLPERRMSIVYVDDVARGCLLALENGVRGQKYILASPSITVSQFIDELAAVTGRRRPRISLPGWLVGLVVGAAWAVRPITRWRPPITMAGVRYGGTIYDGSKATRELGLNYTELGEALAATAEWILNPKE